MQRDEVPTNAIKTRAEVLDVVSMVPIDGETMAPVVPQLIAGLR